MKSILHAAALIVCAMTSSGAQAGVTEKVLYTFTGGADGANPYAPLLADTGGKSGRVRALYGTASGGGLNGDGTVFELLPPEAGSKIWTEATSWTFTGGADGANPYLGMLSSEKKHMVGSSPLYGTVYDGANGYGSVFSLQGGTLTTLYAFAGGNDGGYPYFGVVADKRGALYTAASGAGALGCGTIVQLTPPAQGQTAWTETTLYTFTGGADGCSPNGLIIDSHGSLVGTTYYGGSQNDYCSAGGGCGSVFKLLPPRKGQTAWTEQTLWTFQGGSDGASSSTTLTEGAGGVLYGTTQYGGSAACSYYSGCGTVFSVTPPADGTAAWTEQVLAVFSASGNSSIPESGVIIDQAGALYGTTSSGGYADGTVFRLAPPVPGQTAWSLETLFAFAGGKTGSQPWGALIVDGKGVLYGTTVYGGITGNGNVFSLTVTGFAPRTAGP